MDAYTPFPVEGWPRRSASTQPDPADRPDRRPDGRALGGFFMQWYSAVDQLPDQRRRAGRFNSWPAFIPITFEMTVLVARAGGRVRHARRSTACRGPTTRSSTCPSFVLASEDRFFLCHPGPRPAVRPRGDASNSLRGLQRQSDLRCSATELPMNSSQARSVPTRNAAPSWLVSAAAGWSGRCCRCLVRLPQRHVRPAAVRAARGQRVLRRRHLVATAGPGTVPGRSRGRASTRDESCS